MGRRARPHRDAWLAALWLMLSIGAPVAGQTGEAAADCSVSMREDAWSVRASAAF